MLDLNHDPLELSSKKVKEEESLLAYEPETNNNTANEEIIKPILNIGVINQTYEFNELISSLNDAPPTARPNVKQEVSGDENIEEFDLGDN